MITIVHVLVAVASLASSGYLFVRPSTFKLHVTFGLTAATLLSGSYLVIALDANVLRACMMGLVLVGIVTLAAVSAQSKMSRAELKIDNMSDS